jgi:hypothetical protein
LYAVFLLKHLISSIYLPGKSRRRSPAVQGRRQMQFGLSAKDPAEGLMQDGGEAALSIRL